MKSSSKFLFIASIFSILFTQQIFADVVILDDQIIDGSQCVGVDCVDGEEFDFDTLRLKEDNPVIKFQDTSNSASFPSSDWSMGIADDVANTSIFYINDANTDTPVLRLSANANGGVALGANSELLNNTISVGSSGAERKITHVNEGVDANDAVNVSQFDTFKTNAAAASSGQLMAFDTEVTTLEADLAALTIRLDDVVTRLNNLP